MTAALELFESCSQEVILRAKLGEIFLFRFHFRKALRRLFGKMSWQCYELGSEKV